MRIAGTLPLLLALFASMAFASVPTLANQDPVVSGYGRELQFAGYTWRAKISNVLVGPGPNLFSDGPRNVWTDESGKLHLRAAQDATGNWQAAEVVLQPSLGYGNYCFQVEGFDRPLDPNLVFGMFTWNDRPEDNHRELDIEISRWSLPNGTDGRYTVQPFEIPDHTYSFNSSEAEIPSTHCMEWTESAVEFKSWQGPDGTLSTGSQIADHMFTDGIPHALDEQVRINLWLLDGRPPTDGQPAEVVVAGFNFTPPLGSQVMETGT